MKISKGNYILNQLFLNFNRFCAMEKTILGR